MAHITGITDHGTIVSVHLSGGGTVHFDHSSFRWMAEARQSDLRGECHTKTVDGQLVLVFDNEEGGRGDGLQEV